MSDQGKNRNVIVVGGGLAGLSAAMKLAEQGCHVKIISVTKVKRSHSVCAQGGINAGMNLKGEGDSPLIHAYDTIKGGDFLANQPPIVEMCLAAPAIIYMMDRFGCPFNRTPEGNLDFRRFGGTLYNRTAFCGASTGQQLLYALDEQVRRYETMGKVEKFESHEFMRLVLDENGVTRGIVLMDLFNLNLEVIKADAVVIATGGPGLIFKKSTNSTFCTGAANGRLYMQGMAYANGEFIQIHPTAIPGPDKLRLISESVRGEGGRIWVYGNSNKTILHNDKEIPCGKTGEPWYFLEEMYPAFGNLVPRDIASREILRLCEMGLGVDGEMQVYLDISHLPQEKIDKLKSVLEIYEKFTGTDPQKVPMKIFPAVHYSMGGAWVDWPAADDPDRFERYRQMTNIPGCFNIGESDYQFHGANRLGANSLLSCIFGGLVGGVEIPRYLDNVKTSYRDTPSSVYERALSAEQSLKQDLMSRKGPENVHKLHDELADWMVKNVTVVRNNKDLQLTLDKIKELKERYRHISLDDHGQFANQTYIFANQFGPMLELAMVMTKSALLRDEFRGCHYKPEFPKRDDENWLKTTIAKYDENKDEPVISYEAIDTRHLKPILRDYTNAKKVRHELENIPANIELPI
ncbi:MAG: succinate dehydrogenase flavoprotein subunit [Parachlamydiaceae bacterium]|nr:succinate dehydrogenase flavoprotein subunit [Parachlamydiaceae bacterium]